MRDVDARSASDRRRPVPTSSWSRRFSSSVMPVRVGALVVVQLILSATRRSSRCEPACGPICSIPPSTLQLAPLRSSPPARRGTRRPRRSPRACPATERDAGATGALGILRILVGQRRRDLARSDRVDGDRVLAELLGHRLDEAAESVLGGDVRRRPHARLRARARS